MPPAPDPSFRLYDSLTRTVRPVEPLEPDHLRLYLCGPTVYSHAHIGNFRTFLTADLILRAARSIGWRTRFVSNITDVGHLTEDDVADAEGEDKMARALQSKEGQRFANIWDLARFYTDSVLRDWQALHILEPDVRPRATQHIREQILAVESLIEKGHAYRTGQGVYFRVASFPEYGKLSGNTEAERLTQGARDIVQDDQKRDPRDFALWKADDKHLMQWHSPWGWGFPGWHIECSVMARQYLGDTLDIHVGGEDLRFPHHECEIAQAESLTGQPFARHWVHARFLQVEGEKMAKSQGNFFTVQDIIAPKEDGGQGIPPLALRYALIAGHYRKPFNFTNKALLDAAKNVVRFEDVRSAVLEALEDTNAVGPEPPAGELGAIYDRARDAMLDDLNTPVALAACYEGFKHIGQLSLSPDSAREAASFIDRMALLLGIVRPVGHEEEPRDGDDAPDPLAAEIEQLLEDRAAARAARDWARADQIRDRISELGVEVMDSPEGTTWRRKTDF